MLVVSVVLLMAGGLADMVSAAIRQTILLTASDDDVRGRLQGVFIVVVAGGPRVADVLHGWASVAVGPAAAIGGGGVLVVLGIVSVALAAPSFRRYRP